jgi:hypothetical protein
MVELYFHSLHVYMAEQGQLSILPVFMLQRVKKVRITPS